MMTYTNEDLLILEKEEDVLKYDTFTSRDALNLGNAIEKASEKYDRGISIQIVRQNDGVTVFQYVNDDKNERNLKFGDMKRQLVLDSGHSSAWTYVAEQLGTYKPREGLHTTGGAFPIRLKDGTLAAIVMVSGLHEGKDHQVVIDGLQQVLSIPAPSLLKEIQ